MCVEHISTALCAPTKTPSLSFTCGRLHLIAGKRDICDNAKGTCACFFGTCGQISRVAISSAVDWADVPKVRCVACTEREDHVGEGRAGRDLLESPLLTRHAINDAEQAAYMTRLRDLWQGSDSCPFHKDGQITVAQDPSDPVKDSEVVIPRDSPVTSDATVAATEGSSGNKSQSSSVNDPFGPKRGLAASCWAGAPPQPQAPIFTPRIRRPIPIVRPASARSSRKTNSPAPSATKTPPVVEVKAESDASERGSSAKADWVAPHLRMAPHLRHRVDKDCGMVKSMGASSISVA